MNFADTNWLEAMFFNLTDTDKKSRSATVQRFLRQHSGPIGLSHLVYLEARNVFSRISGEAEPEEWRLLQHELNGRLYLDPMNWDFLRRESFALIARYGFKESLGTFDLLCSPQPNSAARRDCYHLTKHLKRWQWLKVWPYFHHWTWRANKCWPS